MMLNELVDVLSDKGGSTRDFEVVLAVPVVDDVIGNVSVERRTIVRLEIDDIGPELIMFPSGFTKEPVTNGYLVSDFIAYKVPTADCYELMAVNELKELPAGRTAISTKSIVGALWYEEMSELWLLQSPKEQWPNEWFA